MKQETYIEKTSFNEDLYKDLTLEEVREKVKDFPAFSKEQAEELTRLQTIRPTNEEDLKANTHAIHKLLFARHRASSAAMCLDPYFEHFDKENGIRAIECDYILRELF